MMPSWIPANKSQWEIISKEEGIKVSRRDLLEYSIAEFKVEGIIEATCTKLISMLSDLSYYPYWVERCIKAELLEKNFSEDTYDMPFNEYYQILYAETDFPWPFQNRDYILKGRLSYFPPKDGRTEYYAVESHAVQHKKKPRQQGKVRLTTMSMIFKLIPLGKHRQKTHVDMIVHVDLGGIIPGWLTNFLSKGVFFNTFQRMRKLVLKETYNSNYERLIRYHTDMHLESRK